MDTEMSITDIKKNECAISNGKSILQNPLPLWEMDPAAAI